MVSSQQPRQRRSTAAFGSGSTSQLSTITVLRSVLFTKQLNAYKRLALFMMFALSERLSIGSSLQNESD